MLLTSVAVRPTAAKNVRRFGTTFRKSSRLTAWTVAGPANMNVSPYAVANNAGSAEAVALAYTSNNALTALLASAIPHPFGSVRVANRKWPSNYSWSRRRRLSAANPDGSRDDILDGSFKKGAMIALSRVTESRRRAQPKASCGCRLSAVRCALLNRHHRGGLSPSPTAVDPRSAASRRRAATSKVPQHSCAA